jgi:hypothetical protein
MYQRPRLAQAACYQADDPGDAMRLQGGRLMHPETARRGRLLYAALGFLGLDVLPAAMPPEQRALHAWLDTWHGIGLSRMASRARIATSLTRYGDRWGASVFVTGKNTRSCKGPAGR